MRLYRGLEEIEAERAVGIGLHLLACSVLGCRHLVDKGHHIAQKFHHAAHAHVLEGAHAKHGADAAVDETLAYAFAHLVLGESALLKELVHERLVVFGCHLHQRLVHFLCLVEIFGSNIAHCGCAALRPPSELLHDEHINHRVEARTRLCGKLYGYHFVAKGLFELVHNIVVVHILGIHLVERKDDGLVDLACSAVDVLCAHFHAILAVDYNHAAIGHIERCDGIANKIVHAWAVYHIELLVVELSIKNCGEYRVAILLLDWEVVAHGVAVLYSSTTVNYSTLVKHSFGECGFSGAFAA